MDRRARNVGRTYFFKAFARIEKGWFYFAIQSFAIQSFGIVDRTKVVEDQS